MASGSARRGRRDNGLDAADYAAVGDVDPRVGEHLLDVLALRGIAAYLQPAVDVDPVTRGVTVPARPADRLFADRIHLAVARGYLDRLTGAGPGPASGAADRPAGPSGQPAGDAPLDAAGPLDATGRTDRRLPDDRHVPDDRRLPDDLPTPAGTAGPTATTPGAAGHSDPTSPSDPTGAAPAGADPTTGTPGSASGESHADPTAAATGGPAPETGAPDAPDATGGADRPASAGAPTDPPAPAAGGPIVDDQAIDEAWARIVASFDTEVAGSDASWPEAENLPPARPPGPTDDDPEPGSEPGRPGRDPLGGARRGPLLDARPVIDAGSLLDGLDTFGRDLPGGEEGRYVPPPPPPLPRVSKYAVVGVLAVLVGFALFLFPERLPLDSDVTMLFGFGAILAGFVTLVWRLRPGDDDDYDPDDGARV